MSPGPVALQVNVVLVPSVTVRSGISLISKERERMVAVDKRLLQCTISKLPRDL